MQIDIMCSDPEHPVNLALQTWVTAQHMQHDIAIVQDRTRLRGGDILFLVSCAQIISSTTRQMYNHVMVLHASDLPKGRGWSPQVWAILEGATELVVSLLAAEDRVDTGDIWAQRSVKIPKGALFDDINKALFSAETQLLSDGIALVQAGNAPSPQRNEAATYYERRTPQDSQLNPNQSLKVLFNQIRVADPKRYPAYFEIHGQTYTIELKKVI